FQGIGIGKIIHRSQHRLLEIGISLANGPAQYDQLRIIGIQHGFNPVSQMHTESLVHILVIGLPFLSFLKDLLTRKAKFPFKDHSRSVILKYGIVIWEHSYFPGPTVCSVVKLAIQYQSRTKP